MCIGLNMAENHPISMKWVDRARVEKGAKFIVVDPRVTRTATLADIHARIRPGTDIAFIGGIMNYVLENKLYQEEYVKNYTNAASLINSNFKFNDGLFSGLNGSKYDKSSWAYQKDNDGNILKDYTLQNPQCVFQLLKKHYARYTPQKVSEITGCPVNTFIEAAKAFGSTGKPDKAGNICYAMGITQHTYGTQNCRILCVLQLLLGNIGVPGGGVNAQRGESNVQGSSDFAMLYHLLPGYINAPVAPQHPTWKDYLANEKPAKSYWSNKDKFLASMFKAWWGEHAKPENDFCFNYVPKLDGKNRSHMGIIESIHEGEIKGMFAWGHNFAVGGPNAGRERSALEKLDWLVAVDMFETETSVFWKRPGVDPATIKTEVFLLPAAGSYEKQGSIANSGRWIQWRYEAAPPPGEAKSDLWIADRIFKAVRARYEKGGVFPDPILKLKWDYGTAEEPDIIKVAVEINGYTVADGQPLLNFTKLAADGSTACGCWIYSGYYNDLADPPVKRRINKDTSGIGQFPDWAFVWPLNRRIIYNRCSADPKGKPWNDKLWLFKWDGSKWLSRDVPDFGAGTNPPENTAQAPFIMVAEELQGRLFAPGLAEGPFPEHYEPMESPVENVMSPIQTNPCLVKWGSDFAPVGSSEYPYVCSTYRVCEHWQSGIMTRSSPWLCELMPNMFAEISSRLAAEKGIKNGDIVEVKTPRNAIRAIACVTSRLQPLQVNGKSIEMVGLPWHWGYQGFARGDSANMLTAHVGDANTSIPEYKAFLCNIRRVG